MDFESRVAVQTDLSGEDVKIVEENLDKSCEVVTVNENVDTRLIRI